MSKTLRLIILVPAALCGAMASAQTAPTPAPTPSPATGPATAGIPAAAMPKHLHPGFDMVDTNHDGVLSLDEWTAAGRNPRRFARIDANHDGKVTREEIAAFKAMMEAQRGGAATDQPDAQPNVRPTGE